MRSSSLLLLIALAACSKAEASKQSPTSTNTSTAVAAVPAAADAHELFKSRCAPCHGDEGKGNGPGAAALTPKPRNYTDVAWQNSVKDDDIKKTILYGGAAVGKSPLMPGNPDLDGKPELDGLVKIVRDFGK